MSYEYWESVYSAENFKCPDYDGWMNKYQSIWGNAENIIDLGCGCGINSIFLRNRNIKTIICDFSEIALRIAKSALPQTEFMCFDMTDGLPFEDCFSDLVIADLSLHYFSKAQTQGILSDINRVLQKTGHLLCRVNSIKEFEMNEDKENSIEVEHHLFESRKGIKRFFDHVDIDAFFCDWNIIHSAEIVTNKYANTKYAWEICAGTK